jgi:hypothetical protein
MKAPTDIAIRKPQQQQHTYADLERMAVAIAKSGLFGVKTTEQALSLMLLAQAEGLHPAIAARDYHIIDGKPALKADAMLARFMSAGGRVEWHDLTDQKAAATFSHPVGGSLRIEWTIEQATRAELTKKDVWRKYPRAMLRSRVVSEGIRSVYPGVITGVYTPDELDDGDGELRDVTPRGEKPLAEPKKGEEIVDAEIIDKETGDAAQTEQPTLELSGDQQQPEAQMDEKALHDHLANIDAAATLDELKNAHAKAYTAAHAAKDGKAMLRFEVAKKAVRYRLTKGGAV